MEKNVLVALGRATQNGYWSRALTSSPEHGRIHPEPPVAHANSQSQATPIRRFMTTPSFFVTALRTQ